VAASDVKEGCGVDVSVGRFVEVIVDDTLGVDVCVANGSVGIGLFCCSGSAGIRTNRLISNASPPTMIRLINTRNNTPDGVTRIVHPACFRRGREGREEPVGSFWLVIVDLEVYFTRCKNCAQVNISLLLKPCSIKLVINTGFGEQLVMGALLHDATILNDYNPIRINYG
jgi:hypothetical protein